MRNIDAGENSNLLFITSTLIEILKKLDDRTESATDGRLKAIEEAISRITNVNSRIETDVASVKFALKKTGTTYTRWGRTTCPNGADVAYTGYAGGSWYNHDGAASSMLCLPKDPDWASYTDGVQLTSGFVFGAEYDHSGGRTDQFFGKGHSDHDVPCTVCNVKSRSSSIMVPGKKTCPAGWSLEYWGYLMSGYYNHNGATDYYCIDARAETLPGGVERRYGRLLYFVESRCGSLSCPPYVEGRELTCVVCSK